MLGSHSGYAQDGDRWAHNTNIRVEESSIANKWIERTKVIKAIGSTLQKTAMKIITLVNRDKDHIPPITTSETNPFPFHIELNPRVEGWGKNAGMF